MPESKVLDRRLNPNLGDDAGILKCFYALDARLVACKAALCSEVSSEGGADGLQEGQIDDHQKALQALIDKDPVMKDFASRAVVCPFLRRGDLFDNCATKEQFKEKLKELQDRAKDTKTLAAAVRKCLNEISSMLKAAVGECALCFSFLAIPSSALAAIVLIWRARAATLARLLFFFAWCLVSDWNLRCFAIRRCRRLAPHLMLKFAVTTPRWER